MGSCGEGEGEADGHCPQSHHADAAVDEAQGVGGMALEERRGSSVAICREQGHEALASDGGVACVGDMGREVRIAVRNQYYQIVVQTLKLTVIAQLLSRYMYIDSFAEIFEHVGVV